MEYSETGSNEFGALFERCNQTELYQIARAAGHVVLPSLTREALIKIITFQEEPPVLAYHEMDEWRRAIMRFLLDHRPMLETQLSCPAKCLYKEDRTLSDEAVVRLVETRTDACFGCVDAQVINCITTNGTSNFHLIRLRKKTKET